MTKTDRVSVMLRAKRKGSSLDMRRTSKPLTKYITSGHAVGGGLGVMTPRVRISKLPEKQDES
jgi:hypothetical protein